jgi:hypothetical protein
MRIFKTIYFLHSSHSLSYPSCCSVSRTETPWRLDVINSTRDAFLYSGYLEGPLIPVKIGQLPEFRWSQPLLKYNIDQTYRGDESNMKRHAFEQLCRYCWFALLVDLCVCGESSIKADSHITCRAHAVPLPCRASKGLECVFPIWFTQCGRVWFTLAVERRPVGYLPAFGFFRLLRGAPRSLLTEVYQSSSQRSIPATGKSGSSTLRKGQSVKLLD